MENKEKIGQMKMVKETLAVLIPMAWKYKKSFFFVYAIHILFNSTRPFINIILPKFIIDELCGAREVSKLIFYVGLTVGLNIFTSLVVIFTDEYIRKTYNPDLSKYTASLIGLECMGMKFAYTEDKKILEQSEKASTGMEWYSGGIGGIVESMANIIMSMIQLIGTLTIISIGSPILILVLIAGVVVNALLQWKSNALQMSNFTKLSSLNRCFGYYLFHLLNFRYGKDIRLFAADKMMLKKADSFNNEITEAWRRQEEQSYKYSAGNIFVGAVRDVFTYSYLGIQALRKLISLGDFTMLISAASTFANSLGNVINGVQELIKKSVYAHEFVVFLRMTEEEENKKEFLDISCVLENNEHVVEFRNVSFAYPGTENQVLKNVNLTVNPGEHLAVVGLNGAGKTTFIKLFCRLYEVDEGEILLDGINIQKFKFEDYVKLISVVFQDFRLLAFSIKENISMGKAESVSEEEIQKIIDFIGLHDRVSTLKHGMNTNIYKNFDEEGVEPSGGEQQKIAIARTIYKDAPFVILDEPTAALDPMAEYDIYRQFNEIVGGKTAIYISHRLSSCQFCDQIAVFSGGAIAEYGTHDELVEQENGLYHKMFHAQAQYYVS